MHSIWTSQRTTTVVSTCAGCDDTTQLGAAFSGSLHLLYKNESGMVIAVLGVHVDDIIASSLEADVLKEVEKSFLGVAHGKE